MKRLTSVKHKIIIIMIIIIIIIIIITIIIIRYITYGYLLSCMLSKLVSLVCSASF